MEPLYSRLTEFERRAFWLARYDENIVAWYWDCRDLIDIRATIAEEPMRTHSREEFAHVCDAMWVMRIHNKSFPRRTKENLASYLETCSGFSDLFNEERDASLAVNGGAVRSLGFVKVRPCIFSRPDGFLEEMTKEYTSAVERKYLAEHGGGKS